MFFVISQILQFLFTPIVWIGALLVAAFFSRNTLLKRRLLLMCLVVFLFFSNSFIRDEMFRAWETRALRVDEITGPYEAAIVLGGGMVNYDATYKRLNFVHNTDRFLQAVDLYKKGIVKRILISGGAASLVETHDVESELLKGYLLTLGIPDSAIIAENRSVNTYENAKYARQWLDSLGIGGRFLLITSASHMPRALACFTKQGIQVTPYAVDRQAGKRKFYFDHLFIPEARNLTLWSELFHEWIGCFTYWVMGYI